MCSGILYRDSLVKSAALSREAEMISGVGAAEEVTAAAGVEAAGAAAAAFGSGCVEAKRTAATFRINRFVCKNWGLWELLKTDAPCLEKSGLGLNGTFCTAEEENCPVSNCVRFKEWKAYLSNRQWT